MPQGRRRRLNGDELVQELNKVVGQLIKENRALKREVDKLAARGTSTASRAVDTGLRAIQRRAQKALSAQPRRRRRQAGKAPVNGRRVRRTKAAA